MDFLLQTLFSDSNHNSSPPSPQKIYQLLGKMDQIQTPYQKIQGSYQLCQQNINNNYLKDGENI